MISFQILEHKWDSPTPPPVSPLPHLKDPFLCLRQFRLEPSYCPCHALLIIPLCLYFPRKRYIKYNAVFYHGRRVEQSISTLILSAVVLLLWSQILLIISLLLPPSSLHHHFSLEFFHSFSEGGRQVLGSSHEGKETELLEESPHSSSSSAQGISLLPEKL